MNLSRIFSCVLLSLFALMLSGCAALHPTPVPKEELYDVFAGAKGHYGFCPRCRENPATGSDNAVSAPTTSSAGLGAPIVDEGPSSFVTAPPPSVSTAAPTSSGKASKAESCEHCAPEAKVVPTERTITPAAPSQPAKPCCEPAPAGTATGVTVVPLTAGGVVPPTVPASKSPACEHCAPEAKVVPTERTITPTAPSQPAKPCCEPAPAGTATGATVVPRTAGGVVPPAVPASKSPACEHCVTEKGHVPQSSCATGSVGSSSGVISTSSPAAAPAPSNTSDVTPAIPVVTVSEYAPVAVGPTNQAPAQRSVPSTEPSAVEPSCCAGAAPVGPSTRQSASEPTPTSVGAPGGNAVAPASEPGSAALTSGAAVVQGGAQPPTTKRGEAEQSEGRANAYAPTVIVQPVPIPQSSAGNYELLLPYAQLCVVLFTLTLCVAIIALVVALRRSPGGASTAQMISLAGVPPGCSVTITVQMPSGRDAGGAVPPSDDVALTPMVATTARANPVDQPRPPGGQRARPGG